VIGIQKDRKSPAFKAAVKHTCKMQDESEKHLKEAIRFMILSIGDVEQSHDVLINWLIESKYEHIQGSFPDGV
jgi:hypothetical protein